MDELKPTRERFTYEGGDIEIEHYHRYQLASALADGKRILDIASGEGYGSHLLSKSAKHVTGVDISKECVEYANRRYGGKNLEYRHGEAAKIPLEEGSVDMVVSFETLEHHDQHDAMFEEIRRVLVPGGILVISSPDKRHYSDDAGFQNEFHVKELYFEEFKELVSKFFQNHRFYFQRMVKGSLVLPEAFGMEGFGVFEKDPGGKGDGLSVSRKDFGQLYEICVASDGDPPPLETSLFDGESILLGEFQKLLAVETSKYLNVVQSPTWHIGNAVLLPFKWFRKLFKGNG